MSGTSPNLPRRGCFAVTIADLRSSASGSAGKLVPLVTIAATSSATAFRFLELRKLMRAPDEEQRRVLELVK